MMFYDIMGKVRLKEEGKKENVYLRGLEPVFQRVILRRNLMILNHMFMNMVSIPVEKRQGGQTYMIAGREEQLHS